MCRAVNVKGISNQVIWHSALIILLCFLLYGWTLWYGFVWDDVAFIQEGRMIQSLTNIPSMFSSSLWEGSGQTSSYYRPIPQVILALDYHFWARNPFGYHLTNILLHTVTSLLVYLLAARLLRGMLPGLCAALIFAVHPAQAETVAWIGARTEMVPAIFFFTALYAHVRFRDGGGRLWLVAGLLSFWGALLSKEMAVTLPALVFLLSLSRGDRVYVSLLWSGVYGILLLPYLAIRSAVLGSVGMGDDPFGSRLLTGITLYVKYFQELLFPIKPKVCFFVQSKTSVTDPDVIISAIILVMIVAAAIFLWKRTQHAAIGLIWVLVTLLPVSGLPAIIKPFAMANRYLYIPLFGMALFISFLYQQMKPSASGSVARRSWMAIGIACIGLLGVLTFSRLHYWSNDKEFYSQCVLDAPDYGVAIGNLGGILLKEQRPDEAYPHLERAYSLMPGNLNVINNLAYLLMTKDQLNRAEELLVTARAIKSDHYLTRFNLATLYVLQKKIPAAEKEFTEASRLSPHRPEPYLRLGAICLDRGDNDCAISQFAAALERNPVRRGAILAALGNAYVAKGELRKAEESFQKALELQSDDRSITESLQKIRALAGKKQ